MTEDFVWEDHSAECLAYIYEDLLPTLSWVNLSRLVVAEMVM